ncbi:MAG: hypothetical protein ACE5IB_07855 [Candidatus Geothermarchaeales archaeon]
MVEKAEPLRRVEEEKRLTERILGALPGFRGYKEREIRRETDRLIRDHLYDSLVGTKKELREVYQELVERGAAETWLDMDRLIARFDRVSERINHASYGYSGFFDAVKIREKRLDRLIQFDYGLLSSVEDLGSKAKALKKNTAQEEYDRVKEGIRELRGSIEDLEGTFDQRKSAILGVIVE